MIEIIFVLILLVKKKNLGSWFSLIISSIKVQIGYSYPKCLGPEVFWILEYLHRYKYEITSMGPKSKGETPFTCT